MQTVFGGNAGSRRLETQSRGLNLAAVQGCFCPVGAEPTEAGLDIHQLRSTSETFLEGTGVTIESDLDEVAACEALVETEECWHTVTPGKEVKFCKACRGNVEDFTNTCCHSLVQKSCSSDSTTIVDILDKDIFCSTCGSSDVVTGAVMDTFVDLCCSDDRFNPEYCCSDKLMPPGKAPKACGCVASQGEAPICSFCSRQIRPREEQWVFREDGNDPEDFCTECGPLQNPPDIDYDDEQSSAKFTGLCFDFCFSADDGDNYEDVPDCCNVVDLDQFSDDMVATIRGKCCKASTHGSLPTFCSASGGEL